MTQRDEGTTYWVYILASRPGGTLYVGITNDLIRRIFEHREGLFWVSQSAMALRSLCIMSITRRLSPRYNEKRTSSTGHVSGRLIL